MVVGSQTAATRKVTLVASTWAARALGAADSACHGQPQHDGSDFLDIMVLPQWMSTVASVGMAIGPSLVYADQAYSIVRKKCALSPLFRRPYPSSRLSQRCDGFLA